VPLVVPVVGRLMAWTLRVWDGCEALQAPASNPSNPPTQTLGAVQLPIQGRGLTQGQAPIGRLWPCAFYGQDAGSSSLAGGASATPRIPVRVVSTVRMQSPARHSQASVPALAVSPVALSWFTAPSEPAAGQGSSTDGAPSTPPLASVIPDRPQDATGLTDSLADNQDGSVSGPTTDPAVCTSHSSG
jgi:hypothetical protein